jgi:hypothetical protein
MPHLFFLNDTHLVGISPGGYHGKNNSASSLVIEASITTMKLSNMGSNSSLQAKISTNQVVAKPRPCGQNTIVNPTNSILRSQVHSYADHVISLTFITSLGA